jgi:hypothetical protein
MMPVKDQRNRTLKFICAVLIAYVAGVLIISLASMPAYYQRVTSGTVPDEFLGDELRMSNALVAGWADERGMDLQEYALYSIFLNLSIAFGFVSVAVLILWKAHREWFNWFTALVLLFFPSGGLWEFTQVTRIGYRFVEIGAILWPAFLLFLYLFPNGKSVLRWTRWPMGGLLLIHFTVQSMYLAAKYHLISQDLIAIALNLFPLIMVAFPLILVSQVYRYLRMSNPLERAQIKWFVAGLALIAIGPLVDFFVQGNASEPLTETGLSGDLGELLMLVLPITIAIGIFRYRLYDIDLIIRRTLIYGLLTATLAAFYFGSILVLQPITLALTGDTGQSPVAIVISTLAIAALFNPLRRWIQLFIDRRFYRQQYDAELTLQAFATTLREEVGLEQLKDHLLGIVSETMKPEFATLWLREIEPGLREGTRKEIPSGTGIKQEYGGD